VAYLATFNAKQDPYGVGAIAKDVSASLMGPRIGRPNYLSVDQYVDAERAAKAQGRLRQEWDPKKGLSFLILEK
jgi:hypothetical protein